MNLKAYKKLDNRESNDFLIKRVSKKLEKAQAQAEGDSIIKEKRKSRRKSVHNGKEIASYIEAAAGELILDAIKTPEDKQKIIAALNNHFIFTSLTDEDKEMVAEAMQLYQFMPDTIVFMQKMPSRSYYVVKTGVLEVIVNGKRVNKIHPGEGFGELALLDDNPRSATLRCLELTSL